MSKFDILVRDTLWTYFIPFGLLGFVIIVVLTDSLRDLQKRSGTFCAYVNILMDI